jgi:acyl carrier protein
LSQLLTREYGLRSEELHLDAPLNALGIDSLGTVEMLWNIEQAFKISLPTDPDVLRTLGDVVGCFDRHLAAQAASQRSAGLA